MIFNRLLFYKTSHFLCFHNQSSYQLLCMSLLYSLLFIIPSSNIFLYTSVGTFCQFSSEFFSHDIRIHLSHIFQTPISSFCFSASIKPHHHFIEAQIYTQQSSKKLISYTVPDIVSDMVLDIANPFQFLLRTFV